MATKCSVRNDQGRPRAEELQAEPRSVHGEARRPPHRRPRQGHEIRQCWPVLIDREAVRRSGRPPHRHLGNGDCLRQLHGQPADDFRGRHPRLATAAGPNILPTSFTRRFSLSSRRAEQRDTRRHAWRVGQTQFLPSILLYAVDGDGNGVVNLNTKADALARPPISSRATAGSKARAIKPGQPNFLCDPGLERGRRLSASHRPHRQAHRWGLPRRQRCLAAPADLRYPLRRDRTERPGDRGTVVPRACPSARQADRARARGRRGDPHRALDRRGAPFGPIAKIVSIDGDTIRTANGAEYRSSVSMRRSLRRLTARRTARAGCAAAPPKPSSPPSSRAAM